MSTPTSGGLFPSGASDLGGAARCDCRTTDSGSTTWPSHDTARRRRGGPDSGDGVRRWRWPYPDGTDQRPRWLGTLRAVGCRTLETRWTPSEAGGEVVCDTAAVSIDVSDIDLAAAERLLATEEGHFGDLKRIEIAPAKLSNSMSAFANADGGELLIGIAEDKAANTREWSGFPTVEDANGHLQTFEGAFPLGDYVDYELLRVPGSVGEGLVLRATIRKTPDIRYATSGTAYVRRGAQNLPIPDDDGIRRLEYAKGIATYESYTLDVPPEVVTNSETIIGFMLEIVPEAEPGPWLQKQLLIRDGKPTVASLLLFSDEPQVALPKQSGVKLYRYSTTDDEGARKNLVSDPITIEGNAYVQVHEAVCQTVDMVQGMKIMGAAGLEDVAYPEVTLHEIVTNAVLHRDYSVADDVHIRVFDNRIEVESPGKLPAHVTVENILHERYSRNGTLVRWINKFPDPPNKDVGEGLRAAFDAMRELELQPPEVVDTGSSVLVAIRHQRLASPEQMIVEYLQDNDEITNSVVRELTGIGSENRVKGIFKKMITAGEIEPVPDRSLRYSAYRLPPQPAEPDAQTS